MSEQLLTVEQAANRLHLQPSTIRRQLREGALHGVKHGPVWRVPESALYVSRNNTHSAQGTVDALWRDLIGDDDQKRDAAISTLADAPDAIRDIVMARSGEVAARYYATPEGEAELADWRALDGEPFYGFEDEDEEETTA